MAGGLEKAGRFDLERASFEAPLGFEDLTNYTFRSPDGARRLVVHDVTRLEGHASLLAAVAGYQYQVQAVLKAADVSASSGLDMRADGTATAVLTFVLEDGGGAAAGTRFKEWSGFAQFVDGSGAQVTVAAPEGDPEAEAQFRQALASVLPRALDAARQATTPAGYVRRQAGRVVLDVPESFRPPDRYQFISPDKKVRLYLHLAAPGDRDDAPAVMGAPVPPGASRAQLATDRGAAYDLYQTKQEGAAGAVERYDGRQSVTLPNGVRVHLAAQSPPGAEGPMKQALDALAASVKPPPRP
jgi:hypothetical protein